MWIWITNKLQNFTQKDLTEEKIFQKSFFWGDYFFLKHPVYTLNQEAMWLLRWTTTTQCCITRSDWCRAVKMDVRQAVPLDSAPSRSRRLLTTTISCVLEKERPTWKCWYVTHEFCIHVNHICFVYNLNTQYTVQYVFFAAAQHTHAECMIAVSVRPSVRPSHAGNASKLMIVGFQRQTWSFRLWRVRKVFPDDYDNDGQPEIAIIMAAQTDFVWTRCGRKPQICRWNYDAVYHSSRDISISGLGGHIAISGYRSLSKSFTNTVFELAIGLSLE